MTERSSRKLNLVEAVRDALASEMDSDERIVLLGEDVGQNGGVFRATDGLLERFGPDRVVDTPLAELGIIGTSVGMAAGGLIPVPEIQFLSFIFPAMDQIFSHVTRLRRRSRGRFAMQMVIRAPYGGGIHSPELHSDSIEAFFVHSPGIKVVAPSTPYEAKGLLIAALRDPDPVLFLEPMRLYRAMREDVPAEAYTLPIGTARRVRQGSDVSLFAWGNMVRIAEEAADVVKEQRGVEADVIDLRSLAPLDETTIVESVQKTGRAIIVHEAWRTGGAGAEIAARIGEEALLYLEAPVARVTAFDVPLSLYRLEEWILPNVERVTDAVYRTLDF